VISVVTDSNAQLPAEVARRYGIEVVPLTVRIDGVDYLEGVDLDADAFYARFESGVPEVSTSQPSPGRVAAAYQALAARGADAILSVHLGSNISGTVNAATLAAASSPVPVRVVDTGSASFGVAFAVWEAAEALAAGASVEDAARLAQRVAAVTGNVFVLRGLELARAGGRLAAGVAEAEAIPVLSVVEGVMRPVGRAQDLGPAADVMARYVLAAGGRLRVAVGVADRGTVPLAQALEDRLAGRPQVGELMRYRIGPTSGAHTGPGTFSAYFYDLDKLRGA
jgi:DegV family protein with EDD domain